MSTPYGIPAADLSDDDLRREVTHLHEIRHDAMLDASEDAFETHTRRMLELEAEFISRFPREAAPAPSRTRAGSSGD
jgi:hypothetical protein